MKNREGNCNLVNKIAVKRELKSIAQCILFNVILGFKTQ